MYKRIDVCVSKDAEVYSLINAEISIRENGDIIVAVDRRFDNLQSLLSMGVNFTTYEGKYSFLLGDYTNLLAVKAE